VVWWLLVSQIQTYKKMNPAVFCFKTICYWKEFPFENQYPLPNAQYPFPNAHKKPGDTTLNQVASPGWMNSRG
jgi:hypothetical protein